MTASKTHSRAPFSLQLAGLLKKLSSESLQPLNPDQGLLLLRKLIRVWGIYPCAYTWLGATIMRIRDGRSYKQKNDISSARTSSWVFVVCSLEP